MAKILGGIQTPDELATKVRRIILLSLVIAVIVVIQGFATAILRSKTGNSRVAADSALVKVLYGLSLPFCGYLGARLRSSTLLGCFTGCNVCGIVLFIVTTFILISGMRHLDEWIEACERSVQNGQQPIIPCEDLRSRYMELVVANLIFGAISFVLNILGCTWGFQLCTHKHYSVAKHEDDYGSSAASV